MSLQKTWGKDSTGQNQNKVIFISQNNNNNKKKYLKLEVLLIIQEMLNDLG